VPFVQSRQPRLARLGNEDLIGKLAGIRLLGRRRRVSSGSISRQFPEFAAKAQLWPHTIDDQIKIMCGRIIQSSGPLRYAIVDGMNVRDSRAHNYPPRWNAAPGQELLVIRRNHETGESSLDPLASVVSEGAHPPIFWKHATAKVEILTAVRRQRLSLRSVTRSRQSGDGAN
jgi:hypothetical protein